MKVSFKFTSKYKSLSHMHVDKWYRVLCFEKNHRSTKSDYKLFSKCVCDLYYASIPSVSIISPYDFHISSQSINICFVLFVHIPLRS